MQIIIVIIVIIVVVIIIIIIIQNLYSAIMPLGVDQVSRKNQEANKSTKYMTNLVVKPSGK